MVANAIFFKHMFVFVIILLPSLLKIYVSHIEKVKFSIFTYNAVLKAKILLTVNVRKAFQILGLGRF